MARDQKSTPPGRGVAGFLDAIRERPLLFAILALTVFVGGLIGLFGPMKPATIEAMLRADIVEFDPEAKDVNALIRPAPIDADRLQAAVLADSTPAVQEVIAAASLTVVPGDADGVFSLRLRANGDPEREIQTLNDLVSAFARRANLRRDAQKEEAQNWIEEKAVIWQDKIEEARAAIVESPYEPELLPSERQSSSERLLRLMIGATADAVEDDAASTDGSAEPAGAPPSELARLINVMAQREESSAAQLRHGTALKNAEAELVSLREQASLLMGDGGLLDGPAVQISAPASLAGTSGQALFPWNPGLPVLVPLWAALSLVVGYLGAAIVSRLRTSSEVTANDFLNDPNWPLPPNARRTL